MWQVLVSSNNSNTFLKANRVFDLVAREAPRLRILALHQSPLFEPGMVEGVEAHDVGGQYALQQLFTMCQGPAVEYMQ